MQRSLRGLACLAVALATSVSVAHAQQVVAKGTSVGLKVPTAALKIDGSSMTGASIFAADVRGTGTALKVAGDSDWQIAGFPSLTKFTIEKISKKKEFTEVEFRSDRLVWVKLRFMDPVGDLNAALSTLTSPDPKAYAEEAYALLSKKFFTGGLSSLSKEQQISLVRYAHIDADGSAIRSQTYKDNLYMVVDLGRDTSVYNDLKFTQATLVAHVLNEDLLKKLKGFAAPVKGVSGIYGLKLEFEIPHESFLDKKLVTPTYKLQLYAPVEQIKKFADADITNQQFIDSCVVIVDDNRVQISLSGGGL